MIFSDGPGLFWKSFLTTRYWFAKQLGYETYPARQLTWSEWLNGGFDILPNSTIENSMNETWSNHNYQVLLKQSKVFGVWDDNDYGVNDGESNNPIKHE